tara:strand:- start:674 stop:832 length:159 start_codon:yes stop_codon:yes gene_type:complete
LFEPYTEEDEEGVWEITKPGKFIHRRLIKPAKKAAPAPKKKASKKSSSKKKE